MEIIITRHGQTNENRQGVVNGQTDTSLSAEGKVQVQQLAQRLRSGTIQAMYSSDLTRCVDTANAIHKYHQKNPITFTPVLREIQTGRFEGRHMSLPEPLIKTATRIAIHLHITPPGGESWKSLNSRVALFLNDVYKVHQNDTIGIVTHNATMQAIRYILERHGDHSYLGEIVPNCTVWRLSMNEPVRISAKSRTG